MQVSQGLIWVWGESGPLAALEAANKKAPISTFREHRKGKDRNTDKFALSHSGVINI